MQIDYYRLKPFVVPGFIVAIILLILVLIPGIGRNVDEATRWIDLGFTRFSLQKLLK